jgi:hypothetical protein
MGARKGAASKLHAKQIQSCWSIFKWIKFHVDIIGLGLWAHNADVPQCLREMYIHVECIQLHHVVTPIASKTISVGWLAPDQRQQILMEVSKQA